MCVCVCVCLCVCVCGAIVVRGVYVHVCGRGSEMSYMIYTISHLTSCIQVEVLLSVYAKKELVASACKFQFQFQED